MRVVVQDNLWFKPDAKGGGNYELDGESMIPVEPLLGRTDSSDLEAKSQELQWLLRYTGRKGDGLVVAQEWIRPDDRIDRNLPAWIDLLERHSSRANWLIFYDPVLAAIQRGYAEKPPIDFSRPEVLGMFRRDLEYLERYFRRDSYLRRKDSFSARRRAVLYVWALHGGARNFEAAVSIAHAHALEVWGDVFGGVLPPVSGLDVLTGFTSAISGYQGVRSNPETVETLREEFFIRAIQAANRGTGFAPAASIQYDDRAFTRGSPSLVSLAGNRREASEILELLRSWAKSPPAFGYAVLGTANNWAEGTTCLPTRRPIPILRPRWSRRKLGHYGFAHLELVQEILFPGVREYGGPWLERVLRPGGHLRTVSVRDFDYLGKVRVRPRDAEIATTRDAGFVTRVMLRKPARLTFRNLDGKKLRIRVE